MHIQRYKFPMYMYLHIIPICCSLVYIYHIHIFVFMDKYIFQVNSQKLVALVRLTARES